MCGIAGFIQRRTDPAALTGMLDRIAHRGPDGQGQWFRAQRDWQVSLGHRRLAIIDLVDGAQPMENEDGRVVITYNGELYNYRQLRPGLESAGHRFQSRSDTEVIVHHFEATDIPGVVDLDGMFAFAIWDAARERLVLARDRMGIKPLYYAPLPDGGIAFASELSSLLAHPALTGAGLDAEGLVSYFFSDYVHPPHTMVRGVRKLPPGHVVVWQGGRLGEPQRYWQVPAPGGAPDGSDRALAERLWKGLSRAVEAQLVADVPVGIFLSGGIDSSVVATLAAAAGGRMKAFSIGFEDAGFDESRYARTVAEHLNVEFISETLHERNLIDVLDLALDKLDEPMADPSFLPTFLLSRLASRHVKVVVGGDGGDELWGGYPTYRAHRYAELYRHIPAAIRTGIIGRLVARLPIDERYQSFEWKVRRFTERWDDDPAVRHLRWMSSVDLPELSRLIPSAPAARPAVLDALVPETTDALARMLALDFTTYMPGSVLTKVDRASMAHGLEVRPPLLDNALVDWGFSLPSRYKLRRGTSKYLLKLAARGKVPDEIIDRPKKGFGIPLATWLRGPLKDRISEVVTASPVWDVGVLNRRVFEGWSQDHQALRRDCSKPLWALLVLDHWFRRYYSARPTG